MNCKTFNDRLPEYLDETLSPAEQTAAREHVQQCDACRQAVTRQEAFAKSLRLTFERETQELSLSADTRQKILNALKQRELQPASRLERLMAVLPILWRKPVWAGLFLLCCALLIFGSRLHRQSNDRYTRRTTAPNVAEFYVIDVPVETQTHVYRRQNDTVLDAVVTGVGIINGRLTENLSPASPLKRQPNQN